MCRHLVLVHSLAHSLVHSLAMAREGASAD